MSLSWVIINHWLTNQKEEKREWIKILGEFETHRLLVPHSDNFDLDVDRGVWRNRTIPVARWPDGDSGWVVMLIVKLYMWYVYGWPIWKGRPKKQKSLLVCASPGNRPLKTKHLLFCDGYFDHNMSQTGYSVGILLVFTKDFAFGFPKRISKDGLSKKIFPRPSGWDTLAWSRSR